MKGEPPSSSGTNRSDSPERTALPQQADLGTHSLWAKLTGMLGLSPQRTAPLLPVIEVPDLSPKAKRTLSRTVTVCQYATKAIGKLEGGIAILRSAAMAAGLVPQARVAKSTRPSPKVMAIEELIKSDQAAAKLVTSILLRFDAAKLELDRLTQAMASGRLDTVNLEQSQGKFFYLMKIQHSLREFPMLVMALGLAPPAQLPVGKLLDAKRTKVIAKTSEPQRLRLEVKALVESLQMRMAILQTAVDGANEGPSRSVLPPPALRTAEVLAQVIETDTRTKETLVTVLSAYLEVRRWLANPTDAASVRTAVSTLTTLPIQLGDHVILGKLFPKG